MDNSEKGQKNMAKAQPQEEKQEALKIIEIATQANPDMLKGLNTKQRQQLVQGITFGITQIKSHSGPLPDPETLIQYNDVIPNGAERIMRMAENEQDFRHSHTKNVAKRKLDQETRGQWFGFIIGIVGIGGGIYLTMMGKNTVGIAAIIGSIATLAGAFLYSKAVQSKQNGN
jgi:uncharacterized membrane protein